MKPRERFENGRVDDAQDGFKRLATRGEEEERGGRGKRAVLIDNEPLKWGEWYETPKVYCDSDTDCDMDGVLAGGSVKWILWTEYKTEAKDRAVCVCRCAFVGVLVVIYPRKQRLRKPYVVERSMSNTFNVCQ